MSSTFYKATASKKPTPLSILVSLQYFHIKVIPITHNHYLSEE